MTNILRALAVPTALAATLALASCGTSPSAPSAVGTTSAAATPSAGGSNAADIMFATMMIPQHAQAVEMADLALKEATDAKVKALARKSKAALVPEITLMSGWLKGGGQPVPGAGGHDMSGMAGHSQGLMSAQEMKDLGEATGSGFDRMWLQLMVKHHQGSVAIAKDELTQGAIPVARKLAQSITDSQSKEIPEMNSILSGIPG